MWLSGPIFVDCVNVIGHFCSFCKPYDHFCSLLYTFTELYRTRLGKLEIQDRKKKKKKEEAAISFSSVQTEERAEKEDETLSL